MNDLDLFNIISCVCEKWKSNKNIIKERKEFLLQYREMAIKMIKKNFDFLIWIRKNSYYKRITMKTKKKNKQGQLIIFHAYYFVNNYKHVHKHILTLFFWNVTLQTQIHNARFIHTTVFIKYHFFQILGWSIIG